MAERTSTRTATQRNTPQAALETSRTTRVTRSQSREISDNDAIKAGKRVRRQAKATSVDQDSSAGEGASNILKERPAERSVRAHDLSTVHEDTGLRSDSQVDRSVKAGNAGEASEDDMQNQPVSKSPGGASAFSGTTARTSRSALELSVLDSEDMMDELEELSRYSDKVLSLLIPTERSEATVTALIAELQTKGTRANKKFARLSDAFSRQRDVYGSASYISHQAVLRTLLGKKRVSIEETGQWRPDAILQKANLAALATTMLARSWEEGETHFLEELEQAFPESFVTVLAASESLQAGRSRLTKMTVDLAIDVRTYYAIELLSRDVHQESFDCSVTLERVFYQDAYNLRGWGVVGLRSEDLPSEIQEAISGRLKDISAVFQSSPNKSSAAVELLRTTFPWIKLAQRLTDWMSYRLQELENQIMANGGFNEIFKALKKETKQMKMADTAGEDEIANRDGGPQILLHLDQPSEASDNTAKPQEKRMSSMAKAVPTGPFDLNSPKSRLFTMSVKNLEKRYKAGQRPQQLTNSKEPSSSQVDDVRETNGDLDKPSVVVMNQPTMEIRQADDWRPQDDDDDADIAASQNKKKILMDAGQQVDQVLSQQRAESNKENIQIPMSQPEARIEGRQKPSLLDRQPNAQRVDWDSPPSQVSPEPSQEPAVSSDEEFQTQRHPRNAIAQRHQKPTFRRPPSQSVNSQGPSPKRVRSAHPSSSGRLIVSPSPAHSEPSSSRVIENYNLANSAAKELKNFQPKQPQERRQWSSDETEKLITLIAKHGISWALLIREDEVSGGLLQGRGQVGLKDKARNMKMDYLRSSRILPTNFEKIRINAQMIRNLGDLGIDYDPETGMRVDAIVDGMIDDE